MRMHGAAFFRVDVLVDQPDHANDTHHEVLIFPCFARARPCRIAFVTGCHDLIIHSSTFFSLSFSIALSQSFLAHLLSCACTHSARGTRIQRLRRHPLKSSIAAFLSSVLALVCLCWFVGCARFIHEVKGGVSSETDSLIVLLQTTCYT